MLSVSRLHSSLGNRKAECTVAGLEMSFLYKDVI